MRNIEISPFYRQAPVLSEPTRNSIKFLWENKQQLAQTVQSQNLGAFLVRAKLGHIWRTEKRGQAGGGFHPSNLEILITLLNMGNRWPGPDLYQNR